MRILLILWSGHKGGAEKNVFNLSIGLKQKYEIDTEILFLNANDYWGDFAKSYGIKTYSLGLGSAFSPFSLCQVFKFLKNSEYDIYHDHISFPYTKLILKVLGKKVIYTVHSAPLLLMNYNFLKRWLLINFADYYVVPSKYVQEFLENKYGKKSRHIYHGVNIPPEEIVPEKNSVKNKVLIGSLTHLEWIKGNDILIKVADVLCQMGLKNFEIVIIGTGRERPKLEEMINRFKLKKFVRIIETINVEQFLKDVDIYISTSRGEAFGISLIEAMSYKLPIVCTNNAVFSEIVDDNMNGFICEPDPEMIAKAVAKLIHRPDLRKEFGVASYEIVKRKFNIENMYKEYYQFYLDVYSCL